MSNCNKSDFSCARIIKNGGGMMNLEIEYHKNTLYIELSGKCNKKEIRKLKHKLYYILKEYGGLDIVIDIGKVDVLDEAAFYDFLDDYDLNYGGNLKVLQS